ncbi:hypothetical protein ACFYOD_09195 [Streptomyces sp. NPDC006703]|uniref:hypothetical protein n=1 Tax=Streptomyces sp. NPDC006703 TaxID=3364759 RepID=UPI003674242D
MRRRVVIGVSVAVVLGLGGTLAARAGGGDTTGYVAVGAAGTGPSAPDHAVPPHGAVELVPLDGAPSGAPGGPARSGVAGTPPGPGPSAAAPPGSGGRTPTTPVTPTAPGTSAAPSGPSAPQGGNSPSAPGRSGTGGPTGTGSPSPAPPPAGPAVLTLGAPSRSAGDHRWCENVTVRFGNTGGTAVNSGTVTFATHVIGLLGVDWATITSSQALPVPIGAGAVRSQTYGVCVEAWRVPLGMHVETRSVTASWG